jgi:hypothetical protein
MVSSFSVLFNMPRVTISLGKLSKSWIGDYPNSDDPKIKRRRFTGGSDFDTLAYSEGRKRADNDLPK